MSKTLIVLLSVVAIGLCLRTGHLQADGPEYPAPIPVDPVPVPVGTTTSTDPSQQPSSPSGPEDFPPEAQEAFGRLAAFIQGDKGLSRAMQSGQQPSEKQLQKLMKFMINDEYFQAQLLEQIKSSEGNEWVSQLSQPAQVRYLQAITSISPSKIDDPKQIKKVVKKLLRDPEIGPALKQQFGDDVDGSFLQSSTQSISSNVQHNCGKSTHFMKW